MRIRFTVYSLLKIANIVILILTLYLFSIEGENRYINTTSIILNVIVVIISHFVLSDASKNKNHLLAILAYIMIFHYELRVVSLNYTEYSYVFKYHVVIDSNGLNSIIIYCIFAYIACWLAFHYTMKRIQTKPKINDKLRENSSRNVLILLYVSLLLLLMKDLGLPGISQLVGILSTFFLNSNYLFIFAFAYLLYRWNSMSHNCKIYFLLFIFLNTGIHTLWGSRSAIYTILILAFICFLAFNMSRIKIRYILVGLALIPIMAYVFLLATYARSLDRISNVTELMEVSNAVSDNIDGSDLKVVTAPIFDRIGFLDYSTEMIKNRDYLSQYIHPINYIKSVIDNLLTPGFNIYDMPRMSFVVDKCYEIKGTPNLKKYHLDDADLYLSSCLTWYGESYLLFGKYFALPIILFVGFFVRKYYVKNLKEVSLSSIWKRVCILYITYRLLYSYGLDWLLIEIVGLIINFYIFKAVAIENIKISPIRQKM